MTRTPENTVGKPYPVGVRRPDAVTEKAGEAVGMAIDTDTTSRAPADGAGVPVVLRVTGVKKSFHRGIWPRRHTIPVLVDACMDVGAGELVGLVGENGSGKSTLMQIVVGLLGRDADEIERPQRLGYCPQVPMLWDKLTVDEHFDVFARAYSLNADAASTFVDALLAELDFAKYRGYRIEELFGGTRQKLNLALSPMHEPQLLLLDEPYLGFDWETYLRFWEMSERRRDQTDIRRRTVADVPRHARPLRRGAPRLRSPARHV